MNSRIRGALAVALLLTVVATAQMSNGPQGALVVNGVTGSSPLDVVIAPGSTLTLSVTGNPNVPWVLGFAPDISINETVFAPGLALDIGPYANVVVLMDGTASPAANFWNAFANTGPGGASTLSFPISIGAPQGLIGALQAFLIDFSLPGFVKATAATRLHVRGPTPDLLYSATPATGPVENVSVLEGGVFSSPGSPAAVAYKDIGLRRHGVFEKNEGTSLSGGSGVHSTGGFFRRRPPTAHQPRFFNENSGAPRIRTIHGDLYHVLDVATNLYGFMLVEGTGQRLLTDTLRAAVAGASPWKAVVAIDGPVVAAVESVAGGPDKVELILLDQTVWSQTGTEVRDVTPVSAPPTSVAAESLILLNDVLFFTGATAGAEALYRVDAFSTQTAATVAMPNFSGGVPASFCSREGFVDETSQTIWLRVADAVIPNATAIVRVSNINPGSAPTIASIVTFSFSGNQTVIEEFGRAHNGETGRFAVAPGAQRIAFTVRGNTSNSQNVLIRDIATATTTVVTSSARFLNLTTNSKAVDLTWTTSDRLIFWFGQTVSSMDLYAFDVTGSVITNITNTSGAGSTTPIFVGTGSRIDPQGQILLSDRLLFLRSGLASAGVNFNFNVKNIVCVNVQTLAVTNVTGDEFPGASTPALVTTLVGMSAAYSEAGSIIWFAGTKNTTYSELYSYDTQGAFTTATPHILSSVLPNGRTYFCEPTRDGTGCHFTESFQNTNGGTGIYYTPHVGTKTLIVPAFLAEDYFDIVNFPANAQHDGFFVVHSFSNNTQFMTPSVLNIRAYDAVLQSISDVTPALVTIAAGATLHLLAVEAP